jgi:hypothetical protein
MAAALALFFFAPVAVLTAVVITARTPLDPIIRAIALGTVCLCLTAAALHTR